MNNVQDDAIDPNISQLRNWTEHVKELRASTVMGKGSELCKLYEQYDRCSLRDGVVYRRWKPANNVIWQWQLVLPKSMRENAIHSLNDKSSLLYHTKTTE